MNERALALRAKGMTKIARDSKLGRAGFTKRYRQGATPGL
jgi:DNA-binding phage protein